MVAITLILVPLMALLMAAGMIQLPAEGQPPDRSFSVLILVVSVVSVLAAVKFLLTVPIASAEPAGPLEILKRSWTLSRGSYWPLLGLELLLLVAALVLLIAAQVVGGTLGQLFGGAVVPFSLSALILAIFLAAAEAVFTVLVSMMLARIYVQLAGHGEVQASVPSSGM